MHTEAKQQMCSLAVLLCMLAQGHAVNATTMLEAGEVMAYGNPAWEDIADALKDPAQMQHILAIRPPLEPWADQTLSLRAPGAHGRR
jgi:hypothetical protein